MEMVSGKEYPSTTPVLSTNCGKFYFTLVFSDETGELIRVTALAGKAGGCVSTQLSSFLMLVNDMLEFQEVGTRLHRYSQFFESYCDQGPDCCIAMLAHVLFEVEESIAREGDFNQND